MTSKNVEVREWGIVSFILFLRKLSSCSFPKWQKMKNNILKSISDLNGLGSIMKILAFLSIALLLFGKGVCLSQENEDINMRLIHEIHSRNVLNVKKLLKIGGDPNFNESNSGRTPLLHASSIKNNAKIVKLLIQHGAEIDFQDDYNGFTPLQCAIYDRRFKNATLLLDAGANVR